MLEIELKARVADREAVEKCLAAFMSYAGKVDKRDEYWSVPIVASFIASTGFHFRLRAEPGQTTVTFKEKTYANDIEINREVQFGITDAEAFHRFLTKMSGKLIYRKSKTGSAWKNEKGILAELIHVDKLGQYLEVESLSEESEEIDVGKKKAELMEIITRCGLAASDIEARPYSQLLGMPGY